MFEWDRSPESTWGPHLQCDRRYLVRGLRLNNAKSVYSPEPRDCNETPSLPPVLSPSQLHVRSQLHQPEVRPWRGQLNRRRCRWRVRHPRDSQLCTQPRRRRARVPGRPRSKEGKPKVKFDVAVFKRGCFDETVVSTLRVIPSGSERFHTLPL